MHEQMEQWKNSVRNFQQPLQEIMALNLKTLQNMSYLRPEELTKLRRPEELLERNIHVFIENSHKTLNYMEEAFHIFEKHMLSAASNARKFGEQSLRQAGIKRN
ncbi:TPA: phasin family protein [Legionella feeleii]|uniref:Phasin protein n=1 Tax=Legionella feeleii TaxID=453 RepID=A0A0W0TSE0_9GAMM|nr:hypothetical protein [Legionella feeleii]KTC98548.1 hypothetical protein Lfee_1505 [Legionella feeleii]SPX62321.1 Uncharacterised protein [Legionella feeleii]STX37952.1 Uncharacterised protein [Legionella feeleii]